MKRLVSLILMLTILAGILTTGGVFAAKAKLPFVDVKDDDWYYSSVEYVYENRIMQGTAKALFEPDLTLSRGMGVTLLYRVDGEPEAAGGLPIFFEDVPAGEWYTKAVAWAYANDIVKGRSDTEFAPDDDITRAEFAAILARFAEYAVLTLPEKRDGNIADENDIPSYAKDAVKTLYKAEVINGRDGYIFDPSAEITRAEAAAMIERFVKNAEEKEPDESDPPVTGPDETDPPVTEPDETDPPVTEPDETDPPITEPDEVINICLFNYEGYSPFGIVNHLETFPEKGNIKVHDYSKMGWCLSDYINWLSENPDVAEWIREEADIILLEELKGGFPTVGEDADIAAIADHIDTISHGFYKGENVVGQFMELLGEDKEYYSYSASVCGGVMKYGEYVGTDGELKKSQNAALLNIKKILKDKYNITHIFASDVAAFEPDLGLAGNKGTYFDFIHPLPITQYCKALTIYCGIFSERAAEQNNGTFSIGHVPGNTEEEKAEYMVRLKNVIDEIIDVQNGEVPSLPTYDEELESEPVERPDDGCIDIYFFGNSITLQGYTADHFKKLSTDVNIKTYDNSQNGASLESHLKRLEKRPDYVETIAENADIIILQEYGSALPTSYEGGSVVGEFMDLFGRDKEYYVHCGSTVRRADEYIDENGTIRESYNRYLFNEKMFAEEEFGYKIIFTSDLAAFAPELGLDERDTFPDGIHPSKISGYNAALTMYCSIFGEAPADQNNGALTDDRIPGDTKAEKDAFMIRLKEVVKDLIDIQNG